MGGLIGGIIRSKTGMRIPTSALLGRLGLAGGGLTSIGYWLGPKLMRWYKKRSARQRTKARYGF